MKKKYEIVKTELFNKQMKKLPKKEKQMVNQVLKSLSKNKDPKNFPGTMSVFEGPSVEELKNWMKRTKPETISLVLEYLLQKKCLNKKGVKLVEGFDEKYELQ